MITMNVSKDGKVVEKCTWGRVFRDANGFIGHTAPDKYFFARSQKWLLEGGTEVGDTIEVEVYLLLSEEPHMELQLWKCHSVEKVEQFD